MPVSTCDAKYYASGMACKQAVCLQILASGLGITKAKILLRTFLDSACAKKVAENESDYQRDKRIETQYEYVRP